MDGGETFLHADRTVHPDNSPFSGEIVFPRGEQELKEQFYTGEDRILKNEFVSSANYLSTLARLFPKMGFWFLHPGDGFGRTADWEGMSFDYKGMIVGSRAPGGPTIASIDLDLFAAQNDRAVESALFNRLIGFAKKARIVMVFTSPGFIDALRANLLAQKMADHLVNCR